MSIQIFIGNIAWEATEDEIRQAFEEAGLSVVNTKIVYDAITKKNRGYGFVTVNGRVDAETVIGKMNGCSIRGRNILVEQARGVDRRQGQS